MGWMRIRAGSNVPRTVTVTYNLTGLTTNGASTASAYTSFSFVLLGGGNRVPPDTIRIWVGGVFQAQGIGYTYNTDTGAVTIRNVVGDVVVEAIGKIGTFIYSPAVGFNYFAILRPTDAQNYYVYWFASVPEDEWKPVYGSASITFASIITVRPEANVRGPVYSSDAFGTLDEAVNALFTGTRYYYNPNSRWIYSGNGSSGVNAASASMSGKWPFSVGATNAQTPLYALTYYYIYVNRSTSTSSVTYSSTPSVPETTVEYDTIKYQS